MVRPPSESPLYQLKPALSARSQSEGLYLPRLSNRPKQKYVVHALCLLACIFGSDRNVLQSPERHRARAKARCSRRIKNVRSTSCVHQAVAEQAIKQSNADTDTPQDSMSSEKETVHPTDLLKNNAWNTLRLVPSCFPNSPQMQLSIIGRPYIVTMAPADNAIRILVEIVIRFANRIVTCFCAHKSEC